MSATAIENALKSHLATTTVLPKAWPKQDFVVPPIPAENAARQAWGYIAVDFIKAATTDRTIGARSPEYAGRLIATVVVAKDSSSGAGNAHADAVAAAFPMGLRIPAGDVTITIMQPPHVREGMPDGLYWRVPVSITYMAR